jgi:hypothetical protein
MNAATETREAQELTLIEDATPVAQNADQLPAIADNSPMAMMLAAQRQGASLADVREMMAIHREMKADAAREAFSEAFAAFRGENIIIPKSKEVDRGKAGSFMQAEYDQVCQRLSPALSRHGFGFRHDQKFGLKKIEGVDGAEPWVWVTCFLEHRNGHSKQLDLEGPPGDLHANNPVQNMQATASFLKRVSLLAITGTATGGEDDETKLRKPTSDSGDDSQDADALQAGRDAAMNGMKELTAWWGALDPKVRTRLNTEFGKLRKAAKAADENGAPQ